MFIAVSQVGRARYHRLAMPTAALLTDDLIAFLQGGRLLTVASCDAFHSPALAPAIGCEVAHDRSSLTVLLARSQAGRLLADVAANGGLTLLCSQAGQSLRLQIKGRDAREVAIGAAERALLARQREALAAELLPLGFATAYGYALCDCPVDELLGLRFTPCEVLRPLAGMPNSHGYRS
ncbi:hypothetical protein FNU76_06495 [Chitinimonas arctica]|uniref:Pyridoxamine 5'-phosphate oxidase putative domain-containing protein n=1 Tax=Chitinimonas arctica TaxID=2594795 RepID=A0A516SD02_9NEIS|nr:hypothetical protein [Chitinimonas arctica]QDQ26026.1 hypothetical protein FNU76_06495 [Chitinimonas arctica]